MSDARRREVEKKVDAIRRLYKFGLKEKSQARRAVAGKNEKIVSEARRRGLDVEHLRQARRFALSYTREGLDRLCEIVLDIQSKQEEGRPIIGPAAIIRLISVHEFERETFIRLAARKAWSFSEIERELRRRFGRRRQGGRRPPPPEDLVTFLADAERWCENWRRWRDLLRPAPVFFKRLPKDVRDSVELVTESALYLQDAVREERLGLWRKNLKLPRVPQGNSGPTTQRRKRSRARPKR
jgi:hypothetical protein